MRNFLIFSLFVVILSACSGNSGKGPLWEPTSHKLDLTAAEQTVASVDMQVGDYLVLEVRALDDKGYTLQKPKIDANILQFGGFRYIHPAEKAVFNTFGRFIYTFVGLHPGSSDVCIVATPSKKNQALTPKILARARVVVHP